MPVFAGITARSDPGDFSIRFGLDYDFVSQEYFTSSSRYDTSLTADPDLTDVALLSKDYLDDKTVLTIDCNMSALSKKNDYIEIENMFIDKLGMFKVSKNNLIEIIETWSLAIKSNPTELTIYQIGDKFVFAGVYS